MKKIIYTLIITLLSINPLIAEEKPAMAVYDLTTKSDKIIKSRLFGSITSVSEYYGNDFIDFKASVIIHGGSYKFFLKDLSKGRYKDNKDFISRQKEVSKFLHTLHETYKVEFYVCEAGLKKLNIQQNELFDYVKVIPTAILGLIKKQNEGYAYIPIGD